MTHDRPPRPALAYTNRLGVTYYVHAGTTKTGRTRYFVAKTAGDDALATMPAGFEITESINGVVSVRRMDPAGPGVPPGDLDFVRGEAARHDHLRFHRVAVVRGEIVVFEPIGGSPPERLADLPGLSAMRRADLVDRLVARARFTPVMKFVPAGPPQGGYVVMRMTYRGDGGWSWPLGRGPLEKLVSKYLRHVGTDEIFELM